MSMILRRVVFPTCRMVHQGMLSMFMPKKYQSTVQGIDFTNLENEDENMRNLFNQYDLDGNGEIDQDELYAIVDDMLYNKASSIYIVQKILEDCDKDHSETITFEEFKDGMKSYMEFFLHE